MAEQSVEVTPVRVSYQCDSCIVGTMESVGEMLTTYPPKYRHKCNNCQETMTFTQVYPYIAYKALK